MRRRHFLGSLSALTAAAVAPRSLRSAVAPIMLPDGTSLRRPEAWDGASTVMVMAKQQQIWADQTTTVLAAGAHPGVTFSVRAGERLSVPFHNMLSEPLAIHWHGLDVPADMDGHPKDEFAPNQAKTYAFDVNMRAGTYFYHSHAHMHTARQVYQGLYGLVIVRDAEEDALGLPDGEYDVPLVLQDVRTNAQRQLVYANGMIDRMEGHLGNVVLVNGTPDAVLEVKGGWYRFRLVNASNARIYRVAVDDGRAMHVIGSDGGLLATPTQTTELPLAPGERYDVLVDFSDLTPGTERKLVSKRYTVPAGHMGSPLYPQGTPLDLLRLRRVEGQGASFTMPATLSTITRYEASQAVRTRSFDLAMSMGMGMVHTINGKLFDMQRIDERVERGSLEIWEFVNKDADMTHPIHLHGGQFQLLSRNGSTDLPGWERGWKDTFIVHPNERVQVAVRFTTHLGLFLLHCHNLEHEDDGMMLNVEVTTSTHVHDDATPLHAWYAPHTDRIHVRSSDTIQHDVSIVDDNGRVVLRVPSDGADPRDLIIPASGLPSGRYNVVVGHHLSRIVVIR